jgi:hypothetical protein
LLDAAAMSVSPDVVTGAVMALTQVLLDGSKVDYANIPNLVQALPPCLRLMYMQHNLSEFEFHGSLADVDMPETSRKLVTQVLSRATL